MLLPVSASPSVDGVPFLMRDRTLRRTTDVEKVFPDRHAEDASFFNWTDLRQLNAGLRNVFPANPQLLTLSHHY